MREIRKCEIENNECEVVVLMMWFISIICPHADFALLWKSHFRPATTCSVFSDQPMTPLQGLRRIRNQRLRIN